MISCDLSIQLLLGYLYHDNFLSRILKQELLDLVHKPQWVRAKLNNNEQYNVQCQVCARYLYSREHTAVHVCTVETFRQTGEGQIDTKQDYLNWEVMLKGGRKRQPQLCNLNEETHRAKRGSLGSAV
jgi:Ser-tRNA(Ala) deacylase AlaX